ncbi:hypothetical protein BRADI_2g12255v3 [Brachypodium distachyon]|uniref:Non-structural maintenance of chromosomes element 1 homolog n=1 Tax=Brachypodium distachyon TaxID=15368 RepID=A0A0Q3QRV7_BRADI|nr:hypothetical protein BRADI_2g12255v3 [Brachypodium distachyon]
MGKPEKRNDSGHKQFRCSTQVIIADSTQDSQSRLPSSITNFSFNQKEKTLDDLIQDRWLSYTSPGNIGLGIRSFLDLRSWFRSNDIPSCEVCNEAGIKASTCPNEGCNVRIHSYCLKKKFSQRKASRACPGCSTEWPRQEDEDDDDEDTNEPEEGQEAPSAPHQLRSSRRAKAEVAQEASSSAVASQPTRSSRRRKN